MLYARCLKKIEEDKVAHLENFKYMACQVSTLQSSSGRDLL